MHDAIEQFRDAIRSAGLNPPEVIEAGKLHRFRVEGDKPGTKNGWYVLHPDGLPAGSFGSWKTGETQYWCAKNKHALTEIERKAYQRRMREAWEAREEKRAQDHARAREKLLSIWHSSEPVDIHPYLTRKKVQAFGIHQYKGCLVIPLRDTAGAIRSLQFIDSEGGKRFLSGGAIRGHYHAIGKYQGTLCIAEGYATGASIYQATGYAVAVAFNAGNLKPVALALRKKFPDAKLILCADNDRFTPGNPGVAKAREAALAVGGLLLVPRFSDVGPFDYYRKGERHG